MPIRQKPEILAPAGGLPQLQAAIHAGADAVYFGLRSGFNARARATGIAAEQLEQTMQLLHEHGVRGYLTVNILVFDEELAELEQQIRHAAHCGVDALIVQDIGAIRLAHACAPGLPLHGSTQMSITDAQGVAFARSLGIDRVVVGRELSLEQIARIEQEIRNRTGPDVNPQDDSGPQTTVEIEAFVHGALCVSYSGQCFSSEAWGGRSANRGQCAQACRLPYGLLVDGQLRELGDQHYLLSPQDLMALPQLPRLIEAGVRCFKIEGRLKGPEYVLSTVSAYREALDRTWESLQAGGQPGDYPLDPARRQHLAQVFSRGQDATHDGLTPGFLEGPQHQELVIGRSPRHRGLYLGEVLEITESGVELTLQGPIKAGDGVVFEHGEPQAREPGGNVYSVWRDGTPVAQQIDRGRVQLSFGRHFQPTGIRVGDRVWRSKDTRMDSGPSLHRDNQARPRSLDLQVTLRQGQPLKLVLLAWHGRQLQVHSEQAAETAQGKPLTEAAIRKAIGQLGDSGFRLGRLELDVAAGLFLPLSQVKQARRQLLARFKQVLVEHQRDRDMPSEPVLPDLLPQTAQAAGENPASPHIVRLSLLCRSAAQVEAALRIDWLDEIVVDFLEVHGLKQACEAVRAAGRRLVVAAPRIFKPGEHRLVRYLLSLAPDALLVRSTGLLWQLQQLGGSGAITDEGMRIPQLHGDFSLNAANRLSVATLLDMGLSRLALSHDVNAQQAQALVQGLTQAQRAQAELIAHHHLPIFHTEHCVFARFLSRGNSYRDCGRPCERHIAHLRDPAGADHLVLADIGCRNTVFNAQAQSAAPFAGPLHQAGVRNWRIELVDEPAEQVAPIVQGYRDLLDRRIDAQQLLNRLRQVPDANAHPQGAGPGSLAVRAEQTRWSMKTPSAR